MKRLAGSVRLVAVGCIVLTGIAGGRVVRVSIDAARERWNGLGPNERAELVERFVEFQQLSPAERRELRRRVERLNEIERELVEDLTPATRQVLDELDPVKRGRILGELFVAELLDRGYRLREELDPAEVELLESLPHDERVQAAREFERQSYVHRAKILAERLGASPQELAELEGLELERAEARYNDLQRAFIRDVIARDGLPEWLSAQEWRMIDDLPNAEFRHAWKRVLRRRTAANPASANPASASLAVETSGPGAASAVGRPDPGPRLRELRAALSPDPAWYIGLVHLPAEERGRRFARAIRERIVEPLANLGIDPSELRLDDLADLSGIELNETVRRRVHEILHERERRSREELRAREAANF